MTIPNIDFTAYEPRWPGVPEINFGDRWRARFVDGEQLPPGAPVSHIYALVLMGERGYVTRPRGDAPWRTVEGATSGEETPEGALKRLAREQTGALAGKAILVGFLECKATSHNADFPAGAVTVRPIYLFSVRKIGDLPGGSPFERRRLPLNEYAPAVRSFHEEIAQYLALGLDRYLVMRARGEI